jgi:outer membrane protein TolC
MPKSPNELEIEKFTEEQVKVGQMSRSDRLLTIVQVQAAEAQKSAANAAKRNATYMLWSVIAAAISAVITAAGVAFSVFNHVPSQ